MCSLPPDEAIDCLSRAAAGLSVVVHLKIAASEVFAELEIEKLVYHLIVNASEKEQVRIASQWLSPE